MALVLTQEGGYILWNKMLGAGGIAAPILHLLGSPYTPLHTSVNSSFAANELAASGYSAVSLSGGVTNWTFAPITQGQSATHSPVQFAIAVPCNIYGYWLSMASGSTTYSVWGEAFAGPFTFDPTAGPFYLTLFPSLISLP